MQPYMLKSSLMMSQKGSYGTLTRTGENDFTTGEHVTGGWVVTEKMEHQFACHPWRICQSCEATFVLTSPWRLGDSRPLCNYPCVWGDGSDTNASKPAFGAHGDTRRGGWTRSILQEKPCIQTAKMKQRPNGVCKRWNGCKPSDKETVGQ